MSTHHSSPPTRHETPPMAASLPSIDFGFENLKERMSQFTARFDEFIAAGRRQILEDKNTFAKNMAEFKDHQRSLQSDKDYYTTKEHEVREQVSRENEELQDAENAIAEMERRRRLKDEQKENLVAQIEETKAAIEKKRAIRASQRHALSQQQAKNAPELAFWEDHLGMRIDGAGVADHLKISYTNLGGSLDRDAWFVVSMEKRDYEVVQCRPKLDPEEVTRVVDRLNETRAFPLFLKDMRRLFKDAAATGV